MRLLKKQNTIKTGQQAEELAFQYLRKQALRPVCRNFQTRRGEIDLIMMDKETLVFIEVRYRRQSHFGSSMESIDKRKQTKLIAAARYYLATKKDHDCACRFDIIAMSTLTNTDEITWLKNAFLVDE